MMKKFLLGLALALFLLSMPAGIVRAEDKAENYLTSEQQLQIIGMVKDLGANFDLGISAYNPAELQVSCSLPVYAYKDHGFVEVGHYLPLLFEGEPIFFISEIDNQYYLDLPLGRWWQEAGVSSHKALALVYDYDSCYVYDGAVWLLLHKTIDAHLKQEDYALLDPQTVDAADLSLTTLRPVLALKDAYFGRFPADEEVAIYFNGERQQAQGWLTKGRTLLPLRDICDMLGVQVDYADATQIITLHNRQDVYTLRLNERRVNRNGEYLTTLDVPAQERAGRTYLPLRRLASFFQMKVNWDEPNRRVDLQTNEQAICGVVRHVFSTMENWDLRLDSPAWANRLYNLFDDFRLDEVAAPQNLGRWPNLDIPDFYYLLTGYDFLLADNSVAASCEIYVHVPGQPLPEGYTEYLLCTDGKWYNMPERVEEMLAEYHNLTNWQRVE